MEKTQARRKIKPLGEGSFPFCNLIAGELGISAGHVHRVASGERPSPRLKAYYDRRRAELEAK